jgi:hydroxyacylglutathione hydrolase
MLPAMKQLATDVFQLTGFPPNVINAYQVEDVLIDSGTRRWSKRLFKDLEARTITALALTHGHADHQGSAHAVCEGLGIPLWCPDAEAEAVGSGQIASLVPDTAMARFGLKMFSGPAHPVARRLVEGDVVSGFQVIETPGHSTGHVSYWRESDRTLIAGDVLMNMNFWTGIPGLHEPQTAFTLDVARNRASAKRISELRPALACFGHGPPLRDPDKIQDFVARL